MRKLQGFVNVAVGLVFLLNRTLSLMFIAVVLGVWAVALRRAAPEERAAAACVRPAMGLLCG